MSQLTRQDLLTIMLFASHIAKIDDNFDQGEKEIMQRIAAAIHLTDAEKLGLASQGVSLGKSMQALSSTAAKQLMVKTLCVVCFVDGSANKKELEFIERVVGHLGEQVFLLPREEWGTYEAEVFKALAESQ